MNGLVSVLISSLEMGLIFSVLAMGVMLTYKVLDIADLSVEGTFPLGAFVFAFTIIKGIDPFISSLIAFIAGLVAGLITFLLYKKLKIEAILAGILTMTMLYSINLRITGSPNITLYDYDSIFTKLGFANKLLVLLVIVIIIKLILDTYFKTEKGYLLIVTGDNESLVKSLGKNPDFYTMLGLMLANGLVALSGSLMSQYQGFVDAQMGASIIVNALASIIIGDSFLKSNKNIKLTSRAIIGAIIYRIISGLALYAGLNPSDLKLITALIVIIFIIYNNLNFSKINNLKLIGGK
ncbi:MAG: ABC transporter permease [Peptoniphilaceae bacterium]